jgi:hypothetical protein
MHRRYFNAIIECGANLGYKQNICYYTYRDYHLVTQ